MPHVTCPSGAAAAGEPPPARITKASITTNIRASRVILKHLPNEVRTAEILRHPSNARNAAVPSESVSDAQPKRRIALGAAGPAAAPAECTRVAAEEAGGLDLGLGHRRRPLGVGGDVERVGR